ncbi:MAG: dihydrolipoyllysine-residue succinyltransferase, partial [Alkalispirochaeta sp.]
PITATESGVISIKVAADTEVEIGTVIAEIDTEAAGPSGNADSGDAGARPDTNESSGVEADAAAEGTEAPSRTASRDADLHDALSPAVRRILEEHNLDAATVASSVPPSGKDGRLTKGDVEAYLAGSSGTSAPPSPAGGAGSARTAPPSPAGGPPSPGNRAPGAGSTAGGGGTAPRGTSVQPSQLQERKKMSNLRKTIAENLVRSKQQSAHLTTFNEVDMSAVMELRGSHKEQFEKTHGVRLGFMSFFVKAAQRALIDFPAVNAFVDGTEIIYNYFYNIGVAISTDAGLLVPVLRDVDTLDFAEIERQIVDFADRARAKRLLPDEFTGGTFTITNGGVFGSMLSTPIPSPPQTAVMGMHSIVKRPVVVNDEIVIRPIMYLALTYDHRIIDGKQAIGFLNRIKGQIEDPSAMLLGL